MVCALSAYQERAGMNVTVCTTHWKYATKKKIPENKRFFENGVTYRYFPYWSPLLVSPAMSKWLKTNLIFFDIVHIHGLYRFPVTSAACWARRVGVPYVIMPHGSLDPFLYNRSQYNLFLKRVYERLFDIPNLNHAAGVLFTAEEEARRSSFLELQSRPVIVPNGIDWKRYQRLPSRGNFRRRINLNYQSPLVLFLGRINFTKGLDLLIPSFRRVVQKHPDANLAIVGPDNEGYGLKVRNWCEEQGIQDRVLIVDHLEFEAVKEAYVDADVFVLSSYTENFGLTVIEAMACGTPVIISNHVNICRQVQEAGAGIVVGLDQNALAEAICQVLEDQEGAKAMGTRGRRVVEKRYTWSRIVEQLTTVYENLIEEEASRKSFRK